MLRERAVCEPTPFATLILIDLGSFLDRARSDSVCDLCGKIEAVEF